MKVIQVELKPDGEIPEFKRMAISIVERPLREVLLNGLHPVGLTQDFQGYWDTSSLAEAIAERLNREEHKLPSLKEFGHSFDVSAPPKEKRWYMSDDVSKNQPLDILRGHAQNLYFVEELSYPGLVEIARRRLRSIWNQIVAREMFREKFWGFNDQRRFLKDKAVRTTFKTRKDVNCFDLSEVLGVEDFRNDDKLLVRHGVPDVPNFRLARTVGSFTTVGGLVSVVPGIGRFQMRVAMPGEKEVHSGNSVRYICLLKDGLVRLTPELQSSEDKHCREKAKHLAQEIAPGRGKYCFTLEIEEVERLLPRARVLFPDLNYVERGKSTPSMANVRRDMAVDGFSLGAVVTARMNNEHLAELLAAHGEKTSGTKDELVERLVGTMTRLYRKSRRKLDGYFRGGFLRLHEGLVTKASFAPPVPDHGLRDSVVAVYVLKHLRGSRILSPDWENTAYTAEDLARALMARRVTVEGVFVATSGNARR